jgi:hypothetical protein
MLLKDWVDVAWSELMAGAPLMANPMEYQHMMYEVFWLGKEYVPKDADGKKTSSEGKVEAAKKSVGTAPPKTAMDEMMELRAKAAAMRAAAEQAKD